MGAVSYKWCLRHVVAVTWACLAALSAGTITAQTRLPLIQAELDSRGAPELTICSQNLENFGTYEDTRSRSGLSVSQYIEKTDALASRFAKARCDVIAVQEILGFNEPAALKSMAELTKALRRRTNRSYVARTGESTDRLLRLGFLVAEDRAEIVTGLSYARVELPKLGKKDKPRGFTRGPIEVQLNVKPRDGSQARPVTLVTFHFKSKADQGKDAAELEWETYRMQMAEALRRVVEKRHVGSFNESKPILVLLGDRNSDFYSASAKILEGVITLKQFREGGVCRLSKQGQPLCKVGALQPQRLFSVLTEDPQTKLLRGSFKFGKTYSWLDDILMPAESLPFSWSTPTSVGDYDSGVVFEPIEASDHGMVWVRLNW